MNARVAMELQPERVFSDSSLANVDAAADFQTFVNHGMRVEIGTESYVTGQKLIALTMEPGAPPVQITREGDA